VSGPTLGALDAHNAVAAVVAMYAGIVNDADRNLKLAQQQTAQKAAEVERLKALLADAMKALGEAREKLVRTTNGHSEIEGSVLVGGGPR
jgi:hypothetical protein